MNENNALTRLLEAADLIRMVEEFTSPTAYQKLSGAAMAGMRLSLKHARENLLASHAELSKASPVMETNSQASLPTTGISSLTGNIVTISEVFDEDQSKLNSTHFPEKCELNLLKRDLRSALDRL